jgi:hypothetical protein
LNDTGGIIKKNNFNIKVIITEVMLWNNSKLITSKL